jgi:uncharacterized protein with HEPN domain
VNKDPKVYIGHILESIYLIEEYSKKVKQAEFLKTRSLQDSIIRRLEIIGEAVKNLSSSFKAKYPSVPWKKMAGMRDVLIHEYFAVDLNMTWKVVKQELPSIEQKLQEILVSEGL